MQACEPAYDAYELRMFGQQEADQAADEFDEERRVIEASANGEDTMGQQQERDDDGFADEGSGVFGSAPTVEQIDALPTEEKLISEAREALWRLKPMRVTALVLSRMCSLPDDEIGLIANQALKLLGNKVDVSRAKADAARDQQRGAETALIAALGQFADSALKPSGV